MADAESCKYKWVVLVAASLASSMSFGPMYAVGVLYPDWIRAFRAPASYVSFVGSLPTAVACLVGPFLGPLLQRFGSRKCGLLGGFLVFLGLALSALAHNLAILVLTFGIIAGFGVGLANFSQSAAINGYFLRSRALAEGFTGGGLSAGMFIAAFLLQQLSLKYTWRGSILLLGGYTLNLCVFSMFFIPHSRIQNHPFNRWTATPNVQSKDESSCISEESDQSDEEKGSDSSASAKRDRFLKRTRSLWSNPLFLLIAGIDFLTWIAIFVPYVHLVERARVQGVDPNVAAWLSSAVGLAGIAGRPLTGSLSSCFNVHPLWAFAINQGVLGASVFLSPFWSDIYGLFALALVVGLLSNGYGLIKASAAVMIGQESFVDAYSWMLFLEGIGISVGPFLAGVLVDVTQSYTWPFFFSGTLMLLASALCLMKNPLQRMMRRQRET